MLSFLRQTTPRTRRAHLNPIPYEDGRSSQKFYTPTSEYMTTITHHADHPLHGRSMFNPPMHIHLFQTETFHVDSGLGRWYLNGEAHVRRPGELMIIPPGSFHCYENAAPEGGEDLAVSFRLDEQDFVMEERFFRNFFGYLEDVRLAGQSPSIFQLMLFLHSVDGPLAVPVTGKVSGWFSVWVSRLVMIFAGVVVGRWVLGYRSTYEEYYEEKKGR